VVDPETARLSRGLLKTMLDSPDDSEPIFQWFDKEKVTQAFQNGFSAFSQYYQTVEVSTCMNLYSLNFWLKVNKVNVVKG